MRDNDILSRQTEHRGVGLLKPDFALSSFSKSIPEIANPNCKGIIEFCKDFYSYQKEMCRELCHDRGQVLTADFMYRGC